MGSGSSAKKKYDAVDDSSSWSASDDPSWERAESNSDLRNCEKCGEMRRAACLENGKWFCVACQLDSGMRPKAKDPGGDTATLRPQPQLRRGATTSCRVGKGSRFQLAPAEPQPLHDAKKEEAKKLIYGRSMTYNPDAPAGASTGTRSTGTSPGASTKISGGSGEKPEGKSGRRRRRAKERAVLKEESMLTVDAVTSVEVSPRHSGSSSKPLGTEKEVPLKRSATLGAGALSHSLSERAASGDYRSAAGLRDLKNGLREDVRIPRAAGESEDEPGHAQKAALPQRRLQLKGGHHTGDRVSSLITRYRFGLLILELGQEGVVQCQARGEYTGGLGDDDDIRLLVQFQAGHDWCLPLRHLSTTASFQSSRAAQLPGGHTWGKRVRSLVSYLHPPGGSKEVWLGDTGVVIGPGQTKGKLAVHFDDKGGGDWNVWPSTLCAADSFSEVVKQRFSGGFGRGDRVCSKGNPEGSRSSEKGSDAPKKLQLRDGEEGTVIGPGHASGWVLVHFDSDERVWSLKPAQLRASSSCV